MQSADQASNVQCESSTPGVDRQAPATVINNASVSGRSAQKTRKKLVVDDMKSPNESTIRSPYDERKIRIRITDVLH